MFLGTKGVGHIEIDSYAALAEMENARKIHLSRKHSDSKHGCKDSFKARAKSKRAKIARRKHR